MICADGSPATVGRCACTPFLDDVPVVPESRFVPQRVELRVQAPGGAIVSFETIRLQSRGGS